MSRASSSSSRASSSRASAAAAISNIPLANRAYGRASDSRAPVAQDFWPLTSAAAAISNISLAKRRYGGNSYSRAPVAQDFWSLTSAAAAISNIPLANSIYGGASYSRAPVAQDFWSHSTGVVRTHVAQPYSIASPNVSDVLDGRTSALKDVLAKTPFSQWSRISRGAWASSQLSNNSSFANSHASSTTYDPSQISTRPDWASLQLGYVTSSGTPRYP